MGQKVVGLHSDDGGANWDELDNPFVHNPLNVVAPPPLSKYHIIAVGNLYAIPGMNNGTRWNRAHRIGNRLWGVAASGPYPAYFVTVGQYGLVKRSAGCGWSCGRSGVASHLKEVDHLTDNDFVACGTVIKTTDNGVGWTHVTGSPPDRNWCVTDVLDVDTRFFCGTNLGVYFRDKGGGSWTADNTGSNFNFYAIAMRDQNNGWAVGARISSYAVVYRKTKGTRTRFSTGLGTAYCDMLGVDVRTDTEGWFVGEDGRDDGLDLYDIHFWEDAPSYSHGWAVGEINCLILYDDFSLWSSSSSPAKTPRTASSSPECSVGTSPPASRLKDAGKTPKAGLH